MNIGNVLVLCLIYVFPCIAISAEPESCKTHLMKLISATSSSSEPEATFPKSDAYAYQRDTNDHIVISWNEEAAYAITQQCNKKTAREQFESEISRLGTIEKLSGKDPSSWLYREFIVEVVNRKLVPDLGIAEISFSNPRTLGDPIAIEVSLKSLCGYTVAYNIEKGSFAIRGAHIR